MHMGKSLLITVVALVSLVLLLSLNNKSFVNQREPEKYIDSRLADFSNENLEILDTKLTELSIETLLESLSPDSGEAKLGDNLVVNYRGWLGETGVLFDTSLTPNRSPLKFSLGSGMIEGFSKGIQGMKIGEVRRIKIPANLAYGENPPSEIIPPNSDLIFDIELLKIN